MLLLVELEHVVADVFEFPCAVGRYPVPGVAVQEHIREVVEREDVPPPHGRVVDPAVGGARLRERGVGVVRFEYVGDDSELAEEVVSADPDGFEPPVVHFVVVAASDFESVRDRPPCGVRVPFEGETPVVRRVDCRIVWVLCRRSGVLSYGEGSVVAVVGDEHRIQVGGVCDVGSVGEAPVGAAREEADYHLVPEAFAGELLFSAYAVAGQPVRVLWSVVLDGERVVQGGHDAVSVGGACSHVRGALVDLSVSVFSFVEGAHVVVYEFLALW